MELSLRSVSDQITMEDKSGPMEISQEYINKFKLFPSTTLFPPNWEALKSGHCPLCSSLMKMGPRIIRCSAKKCPGFRITPRKFNELTSQGK